MMLYATRVPTPYTASPRAYRGTRGAAHTIAKRTAPQSKRYGHVSHWVNSAVLTSISPHVCQSQWPCAAATLITPHHPSHATTIEPTSVQTQRGDRGSSIGSA